MVSEYDLPCTACGATLARTTVRHPDTGTRISIAECTGCGTRHYPEESLSEFKLRMRP